MEAAYRPGVQAPHLRRTTGGTDDPFPIPLRALVVDDLEAAHDLSRAVGWAHRLDDWRFVHGLGHGFAADDAGRLVGTGMYWPFGQGFATLGLVIVDPARQGPASAGA